MTMVMPESCARRKKLARNVLKAAKDMQLKTRKSTIIPAFVRKKMEAEMMPATASTPGR